MSKEAIREQTLREILAEQEEEEEEEEDEEPRICGVCGDQANGYHFNALTCEGCKGFFRRAIKRSTQLRCAFLNNCIITKNNRRQCQACRLRKCQAIGMRKEMIMSDEAVEKRRIQIRQKKTGDTSEQLSTQQEATIEELLSAHHKTFDPTFSLFSDFMPIDRNIIPVSEYSQSGSEPCKPLTSCLPNTCTTGNNSATDPRTASYSCSPLSSASFPCGSFEKEENKEGSEDTALRHVTDLTTYMIQNIISFSKRLLSFRALTMEDQISLLKGATFEMVQIRFNMLFNAKTSVWECGHLTYCIDDAVRAGFQQLLLDPLLRFHHTLRKLGLQEEEYVLMQAISLFSPDRPGVQHHSAIDELHDNLALLLKTCIDCKRVGPEKHLLYPKVMACLTEMRTMADEYSKQVLQIQDIQPDFISPLMLEVVSKEP